SMMPAVPAQAAIPASERDVLLSLYEATNGGDWTDSTGWNGAAGTECMWYGIACDETESHVTEVYLGMNGLTGSLPSIAGLGQLTSFDVSFNDLQGELPSLAGLAELGYFYAFGNQLTGS